MNRQGSHQFRFLFYITHAMFRDYTLFKDHFMSINFFKSSLFSHLFKSSFYGMLVLAFGLACSIQSEPLLAQTPTQAPQPKGAEQGIKKAPTPGVADKTNQTPKQIAQIPNQHPQLPGTNASDLAENAQSALVKLMSEGPCPCDPKKT